MAPLQIICQASHCDGSQVLQLARPVGCDLLVAFSYCSLLAACMHLPILQEEEGMQVTSSLIRPILVSKICESSGMGVFFF